MVLFYNSACSWTTFTTFCPSTAPPQIHSLMKCIFSEPTALNPASFPSCQSSKKLRIIHKDRFLFKVLPSKGTCILTRKTSIIITEFIYNAILSNAQCPAHSRHSVVFTKWMDEETEVREVKIPA